MTRLIVNSESSHMGDGGISNTVEVKGFTKDTSQEVMEMYFENSQQSGGGDVEEIRIIDDIAYITFKEAEVAQRVISCNHHHVDGQTLTVTLLHPSSPKSCYANRVLIQGLNSAVTEELLRNFMETVTEANVREFLYGEEGKVVVTLSNDIDIVQLKKTFQERRIEGAILKVARVAISKCIFVQNLQPFTSHDAILFYFENERRSDGEVNRVEMKADEGYSLVYFQDHSVIDQVLSKSHNVDGADVEVHLHHECLGRRSSRNKSDSYLRISSPGNKDGATLGEENTDNQAKDEVSSSVSSNPDKGSNFVEVQVWQGNDELKTSKVHEEREADRIRTTFTENGQLPKTSNEKKDPADTKCSENSEVEISLELMEEIQSVKSEEISENEVMAAKHQISLELGYNRIENHQKKSFSTYDDSKDNKQPSSVFSESSSPDNTKRSFTTADGINVFVYKSSILGAEVDVIVNAANEDLKHTGGVAKVIADAAGREFIEESKRYIRENGHLNVGASCITSGGNLNYPFVIHTVGPQWDKYSKTPEGVQNCMDDLLKAVIGCFIKAESLQVQSIALPAVSSGIYGVPMEICASQYLSAVMRYRKSRQGISSLKEIHFIDINEEVLALIVLVFCAALENNQAAAKEFDYKLQSVLSTFWHSSTPQTLKSTASFKKMGHSSENLDPPYVLVKNKSKFQFTKVFSVLIYTGDITDSKCKAIVSSEDKDLKSQGGVAKAIKEKAGQVFDYSIANYRGMRHQVGDVIEIDGGKLECKVICCIIPKWTNKMSDEDYRRQLGQCFRSILEKAKTYRSVAMPLIGIGFNNNRIEICGRVLLDYLLQFSKVLRQKEAIREVHIVSLDDRTTAYVKSIFTEFFDLEKRKLDAEKRKHEDMEVDSASASGGQCQPPHNFHLKSKNTKQVNKPDELNKTRVEVDMDTTENLTSYDSGCNQPLKSQKIDRDEDDMQDICAICLDTFDDPVKMKKCGHLFCKGCIDTQLQYKSVCPTCGTIYRIITGNQPKGKMTEKVEKHCDLKGYEGCGMIEITYYMPDGVQGDEHPKPGHRYYGLNRNAYLPNNEKGLKVLHLLHLAFDRRLIFTIGRSITTGQDDMVTWNDIHHKTSMHGGPQNFAYPDPTYLNRVLEELAAKGVTEESENQGPETFSAYERVVQ